MFSILGRAAALTSSFVIFWVFMVFLSLGGAILVLPLLIGGIAMLLLMARREWKLPESGSAQTHWRSSPMAARWERAMDRAREPILITHRSSTEIIYANPKANELFGASLVGRTVCSELGCTYRPVKVDDSPVDTENHPALRMRFVEQRRAKARVTWLTTKGEIPIEFLMRQLLLPDGKRGDYLLVRAQTNKGNDAWLASA